MDYIKMLMVLFLAWGMAGCQSEEVGLSSDDKTEIAIQTAQLSAVNAEANKVLADQNPQAETTSATSLASHPGKRLHEEQCIACHDSSRYTDELAQLKDLPALNTQLQRCNARFTLDAQLNNEELAELAQYLKQAYYRFK